MTGPTMPAVDQREQPAVDRADELRAEHVSEVGGNGCESASVHGCDYADAGDEQRQDLPVRRERCQHIKRGAEDEEDEIGALASEVVG